jgi:DNA-binding NtrC family response regulator
MERLWSQLQRVAPYFRTALLTGEPGTGAEFAARALHERSPFRDKSLKVLAAGSAEIYFAPRDAEVRHHGAVFVEEVEKLSRIAQVGLLQMVRVRGPRAACVIAFARNDLRALVSAGSFSGELAAALGGLRIALPSLRERREDIPALLMEIASRTSVKLGCVEPLLGADFVEAACDFGWPGNLKQMEEMMAWVLSHRMGNGLCRDDFEAAVDAYQPDAPSAPRPVKMVKLEEMVQEHIRAVLVACEGNKLRAAEILGISRSTLYRMLDAGAAVGLLSRAS